MKLDEKELRFIKRHHKALGQEFVNHPIVIFLMAISYSTLFFSFCINTQYKLFHIANIAVAIYWSGGLFLWICLLWQRKKFMKIINKLYPEKTDDNL